MALACFGSIPILAQCTPPAADNCADANVLCGLDEVNGYSCQNTLDIHSDLYPCGAGSLCSSGGGPHNTSWWAFVTNGGSVTITITTTNCGGAGLQIGIWGDCNCGEEVACNPFCAGPGTITITANLTPCKIYYLFVDGCSGDVCDFSLSTSGGASPTLSPLGQIRGKDKVCEGFCGEVWSVNAQPGGCEPEYVWTWDGAEVGGRDAEVTLDDERGPGTYTLCVTAYIGNSNNGSTCDEEGPVCKQITIFPKPEYRGPDKYLCPQDVPYDWHGVSVSGEGEYKVTFTGANCCKYDSIRQFYVVPEPDPGVVYYIGCSPSDLYQDPTTNKRYGGCNNPVFVYLPRINEPWRCDSSYKLYTLFPLFSPDFQMECNGNDITISAELQDLTDYCGNQADLAVRFDYAWYRQSDPSQIISTEEDLIVTKKDDYCVEVTFTFNYGPTRKVCVKTWCENLDEDRNKPRPVTINGDTEICQGRIGKYYLDTVPTGVILYNWRIVGGKILIQDHFSKSVIEVLWDDPFIGGQVCVFYQTICGLSEEKCVTIRTAEGPVAIAGKDTSLSCTTSTILLDAGQSLRAKRYRWIDINNNTISNLPTVQINSGGPYFLEVYDQDFCVSYDTILVKGAAVIEDFELYSNPTLCTGSGEGYIIVGSIVGGEGPFDYFLYKDNVFVTKLRTGRVFNNLMAGNYLIEVIDSKMCQKSKTATVFDPDSATIAVLLDTVGFWELKYGVPLKLSVDVFNNVKYPIRYSWYFNSMPICSLNCKKEISYTFTKSGWLKACAEDKYCFSCDSIHVDLDIYGKKSDPDIVCRSDIEGYRFKNINLPDINSTELWIANRLGTVVYHRKNYQLDNDPSSLWKGYNQSGEYFPTGSYYYIFEIEYRGNRQREIRKGTVTWLNE
ncbi:MAG: gliding motility-associated C-terminal domain-containing protein [Saprospiraceae bacterium]|nr:gliding motility-associated C-terminal domain-containing protein [Saprospiraceae bacterium]